jgi:hypothetical protein
MKVRFLKPSLGFLAGKGEIRDVEDSIGAALIQSGMAESSGGQTIVTEKKRGRPRKNN